MRLALVVFACIALGCGPSLRGAAPDVDATTADGGAMDVGPDLGAPPDDPETNACADAEAGLGQPVSGAACRAIEGFAFDRWRQQYDYLVGDVTARRFRVRALSDLWLRFSDAYALDPRPDHRAFSRASDAAATVTVEELASFDDLDSYTAYALHCQVHALPDDYVQRLETAVVGGYYLTTHVLLADIFFRDNGCPYPGSEQLRLRAIVDSAALIDTDHDVIYDYEVEAAVLLEYLGEGSRIPSGFLEGVLAAQRDDGGWAMFPFDTETSGHTTALAMWWLHELLYPGRREGMVTQRVR